MRKIISSASAHLKGRVEADMWSLCFVFSFVNLLRHLGKRQKINVHSS